MVTEQNEALGARGHLAPPHESVCHSPSAVVKVAAREVAPAVASRDNTVVRMQEGARGGAIMLAGAGDTAFLVAETVCTRGAIEIYRSRALWRAGEVQAGGTDAKKLSCSPR